MLSASGVPGWRASIRPASFRGAAFGVTDAEGEGGRRTVVHEFPQRDMPYVEDMGAATRKFTLQAFVLGPDYMAARDALVDALEQPGPGTLVHPWLGEIQVAQAAPWKLRESAQDGGMAIFTLTFARTEGATSPTAAVNSGLRAENLAGLAGDMACLRFDALFALAGQHAWVVEQSFARITNVLEAAQETLGSGPGLVPDLLGAATGYDFLELESMGHAVWQAMRSLPQPGASAKDLAGQWSSVALRVQPEPFRVQDAVPSRRTVGRNDFVAQALVTQLAVVESARALASAVPASRAHAGHLRDIFADAMDAALDISPPQDSGAEEKTAPGQDAAFAADNLDSVLRDMRRHALLALAASARSVPELARVTTAAVMPWLAICWRHSAGIAGESDLVARNALWHPLFVPPSVLEVLRG